MEIVFLPLAIFLFIFCPKVLTRAVFYNRVTDEWHIRKKWHYYAVYALWTGLFFYVCSVPFMHEFYQQIGNFFTLQTGQRSYIEWNAEADELEKQLPDTEFILVYETKKSTDAETIKYDILPEIMEYQFMIGRHINTNFELNDKMECVSSIAINKIIDKIKL